MIRVLFVGDVCGKPGREAVGKILKDIRKKEKIDLVITNVENVAHGRGATIDTVDEIISYGVDFMTAGNHIWRRDDFHTLLNGSYPIVRGLNYPDDLPGKGWGEIDLGSKGKFMVISLIGSEGMHERTIAEPFRCIDNFLKEVNYDEYAGILLDFHAETTSEKLAMGLFLDGRVSAVLGTHTHIPTADERVLPLGTAYINDVGAVSPLDSVLWVEKDIVFQQLMYPYSQRYEIKSDGEVRFDAVVVDITSPKNASAIRRINTVLK